jgi:UDP-N-acetylglucosamine pyrophosphorylase
MDARLAVIIMAAGKGTRMNNPEMAKVMYTVNGKPLVEHVVDLSLRLEASRIVVIVGWQKDSVIQYLQQTGKTVECVEQSPQLGTGHAVMQAEKTLLDFAGDLLVLSGDVPLLSYETTTALISFHRSGMHAATVLTAGFEDPTGYGRIIRDPAERVIGIVEEKDATEEQRRVKEINSGIYLFEKSRLFDALKHITPSNAQKEYYLTDVFGHFWRNKLSVGAVKAMDPNEIQGINTPEQLEQAQKLLQARSIHRE